MDRPLPSFGLAFQEMVIPRLLERRPPSGPSRLRAYGEERWSSRSRGCGGAASQAGCATSAWSAATRVGLFLPNCAGFVNCYFAPGRSSARRWCRSTPRTAATCSSTCSTTRRAAISSSTRRYLDRVRGGTGRPARVARGRVVRGGAATARLDARGDDRVRVDCRGDARPDPAPRWRPTTSTASSTPRARPARRRACRSRTRTASAKAIEVIRLGRDGRSTTCIYAPLPLFHSFALQRGVCRRRSSPAAAARCASASARAPSGSTCGGRRNGRLLRLHDPA